MKKGFTLIEVMISLFILLVGLTGVIKLQATSAAITKLSGDLTYAQNLAQTALHRQLSRPVTQAVQNTACILDDSGSLLSTKQYTHKRITYKLTCKITKNSIPMLGNKPIGLTNVPAGFVEIKVTWTDLLGNKSVNKHEIYNYGLIVSN